MDNCWYLEGNRYDGYKVITADDKVIAAMDSSISEGELQSIKSVIAAHNEKVGVK